MRFEELTPVQRKQRLATSVRNHLTLASGPIFSPWFGFEMRYADGYLCRCAERELVTRIALAQDLLGKSDEQIWSLCYE